MADRSRNVQNANAKLPIQMFFFGGANATVAAGSTMYFNVMVQNLITLAGRSIVLSRACTISSLLVATNGAQPATGSLVFTVQKSSVNGIITCKVPASGAAGNYSDLTNSVVYAPGDGLTVEIKNNASSASAAIGGGTLIMTFHEG